MKLINFEDIFSARPDSSSIILIEGTAGTLKSALCFSVMLDILKDENSYGFYLTFEQSWKSHLQNMKSLGLASPENLLVSDYNIMRKEFRDEETNVKIFDSIISMLEAIKEEKKDHFKIFALDSLNALYSIIDNTTLQSSTVSFFRRLKELNIITLLIFEKAPLDVITPLRERFLADGIVSLGIMKNRGEVVRFLQPIKLNTADHSLKKRHLLANKDGLALLGSVYK